MSAMTTTSQDRTGSRLGHEPAGERSEPQGDGATENIPSVRLGTPRGGAGAIDPARSAELSERLHPESVVEKLRNALMILQSASWKGNLYVAFRPEDAERIRTLTRDAIAQLEAEALDRRQVLANLKLCMDDRRRLSGLVVSRAVTGAAAAAERV